MRPSASAAEKGSLLYHAAARRVDQDGAGLHRGELVRAQHGTIGLRRMHRYGSARRTPSRSAASVTGPAGQPTFDRNGSWARTFMPKAAANPAR